MAYSRTMGYSNSNVIYNNNNNNNNNNGLFSNYGV